MAQLRDRPITRAEHMAWCKRRALEYVELGDFAGAFASFTSDLTKHAETAGQLDFITMVGFPLLMSGQLNTADKMREFIEGFA